MPSRIERIKAGDQDIYAIEQDFEIGREGWSVYQLLDGGTIRLKTTVQKIYRVVDENGRPQTDANGEPVFVARHKSDVVFSE